MGRMFRRMRDGSFLALRDCVDELEDLHHGEDKDVREALEPHAYDIAKWLKAKLGTGQYRSSVVSQFFRLLEIGARWPELKDLANASKRELMANMVNRLKGITKNAWYDLEDLEWHIRHLEDLGVEWPDLAALGGMVAAGLNAYPDSVSESAGPGYFIHSGDIIDGMREALRRNTNGAWGNNYELMRPWSPEHRRQRLEEIRDDIVAWIGRQLGLDDRDVQYGRRAVSDLDGLEVEWPELWSMVDANKASWIRRWLTSMRDAGTNEERLESLADNIGLWARMLERHGVVWPQTGVMLDNIRRRTSGRIGGRISEDAEQEDEKKEEYEEAKRYFISTIMGVIRKGDWLKADRLIRNMRDLSISFPELDALERTAHMMRDAERRKVKEGDIAGRDSYEYLHALESLYGFVNDFNDAINETDGRPGRITDILAEMYDIVDRWDGDMKQIEMDVQGNKGKILRSLLHSLATYRWTNDVTDAIALLRDYFDVDWPQLDTIEQGILDRDKRGKVGINEMSNLWDKGQNAAIEGARTALSTGAYYDILNYLEELRKRFKGYEYDTVARNLAPAITSRIVSTVRNGMFADAAALVRLAMTNMIPIPALRARLADDMDRIADEMLDRLVRLDVHACQAIEDLLHQAGVKNSADGALARRLSASDAKPRLMKAMLGGLRSGIAGQSMVRKVVRMIRDIGVDWPEMPALENMARSLRN